MKQTVIKDGIVDNNYIRVICEEEYDYDENSGYTVLVNKLYKLQIKIYGFFSSRFHTIKRFVFNPRDKEADELAKNEAIEVFNYLINPYKHGEL